MKVRFDNLDAFARDMDRAYRKKVKKEIRLKLRDASKVLRKNMKGQVSGKMVKKKSGTLHKAIRFRVRVSSLRSWYAAIGPSPKGFYGGFIANGTANRAQESTGRFTGKVTKADFVQAAIDQTEKEVFKIMGAVFKRV